MSLSIKIKDKNIVVSESIIKLSKFFQEIKEEYDEILILEFNAQDVEDFISYLKNPNTLSTHSHNLAQMMRMCLYFQTDPIHCIKKIFESNDIKTFEQYERMIVREPNVITS